MTRLVMAEWYADHSPSPAMHVFVNRVFELSQGSLPIMLEAVPTGTVTEPGLLRHVASGDADLGFVGTRSLDQLGVRALQPLSAPFLIDSYPAEAAVVTDPEVTAALSHLEALGVSGLALIADELSVPVGVSGPLRAAGDFQGITFRTDASEVQRKALDLLGAVPASAHLLLEPRPSYGAYDTTVRSFNERVHDDYHRHITVNAPLWPQTIVLFANPESLRHLTEQQRGWLRTAASEAAQWSTQHAGDGVADELAEVCSRGGLVSTATPAELEELREEVRPLYEQMRADPEVGPLLARVEALVGAANEQDPESARLGCPSGPDTTGTAPGGGLPLPNLSSTGRAGSLPQGVYRVPVDAVDAGGGPAAGDSGVITWTIQDGAWSFVRRTGYTASDCSGNYDVAGDIVTFETTQPEPLWACAPPAWTARWAASGTSLTWSDVSIKDFEAEFAGPGWTRIR